MSITHKPKAGAKLTGTEYEASDAHMGAPTLAEVLASGNVMPDGSSGPANQIVGQDADPPYPDGGFGASLAFVSASGVNGGRVELTGGYAAAGGNGGDLWLVSGEGNDGGGLEVTLKLHGGGSDSSGGGLELSTGSAGAGSDANGGDITIIAGAGDGAGRNGLIFLNLPTGDPGVSGALYIDGSGFVKVSP